MRQDNNEVKSKPKYTKITSKSIKRQLKSHFDPNLKRKLNDNNGENRLANLQTNDFSYAIGNNKRYIAIKGKDSLNCSQIKAAIINRSTCLRNNRDSNNTIKSNKHRYLHHSLLNNDIDITQSTATSKRINNIIQSTKSNVKTKERGIGLQQYHIKLKRNMRHHLRKQFDNSIDLFKNTSFRFHSKKRNESKKSLKAKQNENELNSIKCNENKDANLSSLTDISDISLTYSADNTESKRYSNHNHRRNNINNNNEVIEDFNTFYLNIHKKLFGFP